MGLDINVVLTNLKTPDYLYSQYLSMIKKRLVSVGIKLERQKM